MVKTAEDVKIVESALGGLSSVAILAEVGPEMPRRVLEAMPGFCDETTVSLLAQVDHVSGERFVGWRS